MNPITVTMRAFGLTRDGWTLYLTKWASVITGLAAMGGGVTRLGIPGSWVPYIALVAFIVGIISANHQSSGLDSMVEKNAGAGVGSVSGRAALMALAFLLCTAALTVGTAACGASGHSYKQTVAVDVLQPSHDALANLQDLEISVFNGGAVKALTVDVHKSIEGKLGVAFRDHAKASRALRAWRAGDPKPASVADYQRDLNDILGVVTTTFPSTDKIVTYIKFAIDSAADVAASLK